ncbi:PerC family transcriptional regulator [Salmonella enterica subsp. enterica]|nr:PerC family transcriptional regulator [Salmonella enterica subsp. enterica]
MIYDEKAEKLEQAGLYRRAVGCPPTPVVSSAG